MFSTLRSEISCCAVDVAFAVCAVDSFVVSEIEQSKDHYIVM